MSKKGGYYCAFKNCRGLSRRDKRSFFRFPKDPQRSKQWVKACDRGDLLEKTPLELFNSYRVCAKHFTDSMFLNDLRNRLQPNSVPMQLEPPEDITAAAALNSATAAANAAAASLTEDCSSDANDRNNGRDELPDCQESVAKLLSNCILQKISADEFFKATGIKISEPVSTIKTTEEYLQNSSPSDHIYSSTKVNNALNGINGNAIAIDIDNENPNNFSIEALSYHDLINSLPISLISAPSESSMETSELPFVISDKNIEKLPDNILDDQSITSPITITNNFNSLEAIRHTDLNNIFKGKSDEATQTDINFVENNIENTSQTELNTIEDKLEESTQTESNFVGSNSRIEGITQTESSFLKDKLNKRKLKKLLQSKKHEVKELKMQVHQNFLNIMDNVTLKQYELLTDKFFPKDTSDFIKIQAQLFKKKTSDRKYSLEFKKQCLSLFLAGPRTYKNLQKLFCLPGVRDLQMLKY